MGWMTRESHLDFGGGADYFHSHSVQTKSRTQLVYNTLETFAIFLVVMHPKHNANYLPPLCKIWGFQQCFNDFMSLCLLGLQIYAFHATFSMSDGSVNAVTKIWAGWPENHTLISGGVQIIFIVTVSRPSLGHSWSATHWKLLPFFWW